MTNRIFLAVIVALAGVLIVRMAADRQKIVFEGVGDDELATLRGQVASVPLLGEAKSLRVRRLSGGLSNTNYRVDADGQAYLLRVAGDAGHLGRGEASPYETVHCIDRRMEASVARIAADQLHLSPALLWWRPPLALSAFIDGATLSGDDMLSTDVHALLARFHADTSPAAAAAVERLLADWPEAPRYRPLDRCRTRAAYLRATAADCLPAELDRVFAAAADVVELLERSFALSGRPLSLVHSDLNTANLLRDGAGRLWLLDFEYAAVGDALWDLGAVASLNGFDDEAQLARLVDAHLSLAPSRHWLLAHVQLTKWLTDLQEAMWGYAHQEITHLTFDTSWATDPSFQAYGDRLFAAVLRRLDAGDVARWSALIKPDFLP